MIRRAFKLMLLASAFGVGAIVANNAIPVTIEGSGTTAAEEREIGKIKEVTLAGFGNLTIIQGDVPSLRVVGDDNILPYIETRTSGRKLTLRSRSGYALIPHGPISYTLTVPNLEKLTISGVGSATVGKLTGDKFAVRLSGAGNATLREANFKTLTLQLSGAGHATMSGSSDELSARISGSGEIDAGSLKTRKAEVRVSGSGNVALWATDSLSARVSGSGNVAYRGEPKVEKRVSGSGSVRPISGRAAQSR
jgi:hypothetical protein